jgi:peroxiredoxin
MSTRHLLTTLPAVAFVGLLAALGGCESALVEGKQVGNLCPEIAGEDPDGKVIRLSDYRGKVVLVNFWGTWCGPCRMLLPHERQMVQTKYKGRPFVLLGVAQDSPDTLKEFLQTEPLPWPNIADGIGRLGREWGVEVVPSAVLVDHRGVIRKRWLGGLNPGEVWEAVEKAVKAAEQGQ